MAPSILQSVDKQLDHFFAGWNIYSTVLAVLVTATLIYPLFFSAEADIHPYLLARQSVPSPVRQPGESAVHRSLESPHGYPLRAGLDVKDDGAPRWNPGRNGDLRDVWREALKEGGSKLVKVEGKLSAVTRSLTDLSKEINIIGKRLQLEGGGRVAIYLPNSPEFVVSLFAAAFYGFTPILITPDQPASLVATLLKDTQADILIVSAGTLSSTEIKAAPRLKHVIWVVEETSRQVDWADNNSSSEWHNLISANKADTTTDLPSTNFDNGPPGVVIVTQIDRYPENYQIVEYSQGNLVAATAAQVTSLPRSMRLGSSDVFLPLVPLTSSFALVVALAALHSHSTLALTSSASRSTPLSVASANPTVHPTVVLAAPSKLSPSAYAAARNPPSLVSRVQRSSRARSLAAGTMPFANQQATSGPRLIYTYATAPAPSVTEPRMTAEGALAEPSDLEPHAAHPLSAGALHDVRLATGARVVHALTTPRVAGAVAQSHALDYRLERAAHRAHFGPPPACLELKLVEDRERGARIPDDGDDDPVGVLVAKGPAVVGGEANLGFLGTFGSDGTLRVV